MQPRSLKGADDTDDGKRHELVSLSVGAAPLAASSSATGLPLEHEGHDDAGRPDLPA
jgi:hypothetical protein